MKRALVTAVFLGAVAALGGCPIYNHEDDGCYRNSDCAPGYSCDDRNGECVADGSNSCVRPSDCGVNETCSRTGQCLSGDCSFHGCVGGYTCDSSSGTWECVLSTSPAGGSGGGGAGGASSSLAGAAGQSEIAGASSTAGAGGDVSTDPGVGGVAGQAGGG